MKVDCVFNLQMFNLLYIFLTLFQLSWCKLKFSIEPPNLVRFSNNTGVIIRCQVDSELKIITSWISADTKLPIEDINKLRYQRTDGSLYFPPFALHQFRPNVHQASYQCVGKNKYGIILSRIVKVEAVNKVHLEPRVYDEFVPKGNSALFRCRVANNLKDSSKVISWLINDKLVVKSQHIKGNYIAFKTGELQVKSVRFEDSSLKVRCKIKNEITNEVAINTIPGKLTAIEPTDLFSPKIFFHFDQVIAHEGDESVYLSCLTHGYPLPKYEWFKKSKTSDLISLSSINGKILNLDETLLIFNPTIFDGDDYVCVVSNDLGTARCDIKLIVYSSINVTISPSSDTILVNKGSYIELICTVYSHPIQEIHWLKNGQIVETLQNGIKDLHKVEYFHNLSLIIPKFEKKHLALYQCFALSLFESFQQATHLLLKEEAPKFEEIFFEQILRSGESVSLICSAQGYPLPQITWYLDGHLFQGSYRSNFADFVNNQDKVVSFLNITSLKVEDGGLYKCEANNKAGNVFHQKRINVLGKPSLKLMQNLTVVEGENIWIYCPVYGYPYGKIVWKKDDDYVLPYDGRQEVYSNGSLLIKNVNRKFDEAFYSCLLDENGFTKKTKTYLKVIIGPKIDPFSFPKDLKEGMRNIVFCAVSSGDPPIFIEWFKDGTNLDQLNELGCKIEMLNSFTSTITFLSLTRQHTGNYTCLASNKAASINFTAEMIVNMSPFWTKEPSNFEAIIGQKVILDCQASGFPEPQIRWKKINKVLKTEFESKFNTIISNHHVYILENGSLFINEIEKSDEGKYMCLATNGVNPTLSKFIELKTNSPPKFYQHFVSKTITKGDSLKLLCNASGDQPIIYDWKKDDSDIEKLIASNRYKILENKFNENLFSVLKINSLERSDSALFTCIATNKFGMTLKTFRVIVQEKPESPFNVVINDIKSDSLEISWSKPYSGNSPIIEYIIHYALGQTFFNDDSFQEILRNGDETSAFLSDLKPSTRYGFKISARNAIGKSEPSKVVSIVTIDKEPNIAPQNPQSFPSGSTSLILSWDKYQSIEENSTIPVIGYNVAYRTFKNQGQFTIKYIDADQLNLQKEKYKLSGLKNSTKYQIKVQAINKGGKGPFSDIFIGETLSYDAPFAPILKILKVTKNTIEISWTMIDYTPIIDFYVFYKTDKKEWIWQQVKFINRYTIYGLKCGTRYHIYVVGNNKAGQGQPSDTITTRTEGTAPVAPEKSLFLIPNITFVTLNLYTWHSSGCPILFFDIQYKEHKKKEWMLVSNNVPSNTDTLLISDINPKTWYNLLLQAVNEAGKTDAEYVFATLDMDGNVISPLNSVIQADHKVSLPFPFSSSRWFIQQLNIILPIVCGLGLLILISLVICFIKIQKSYPSHSCCKPVLNSSNTLSESVYKNENVHFSSSQNISTNLSKSETNLIENQFNTDYSTHLQSNKSLYFQSPYVLSHLNDDNQFLSNCEEPYNYRSLKKDKVQSQTIFQNYDTPILLKKTKPQKASQSCSQFERYTNIKLSQI